MISDVKDNISMSIDKLIQAKQESDCVINKKIKCISEEFDDCCDLVDLNTDVDILSKYIKISMNLYDIICTLDDIINERI